MNYILDTNVISELVSTQPDPNVTRWLENAGPEAFYLSVITVGEIKKGIAKMPDSRRKTALEEWLMDDLLVRFQDHLLPMDTSVMLIWGSLIARMETIGNPLPAIDSLLAATTLQSGYTLVTRNVGDFEYTGVSLLNPWEPQES
jgi:predicted nucleic acid-binding protein